MHVAERNDAYAGGKDALHCVMWAVSCELCHVSCVMWAVSCELCHVSCVMWAVSCELCHVSCVTRAVSCELCHVSGVMWAVSCEMCHVSCVTWAVSYSPPLITRSTSPLQVYNLRSSECWKGQTHILRPSSQPLTQLTGAPVGQLTEWLYYPKDYLLCRLDLVQWYWHCTKLVQDQRVAPSWCRTIRLHQVCTEGKRIKGKRMKGKCPRRGSNPAIPVAIAEIRTEVSTWPTCA